MRPSRQSALWKGFWVKGWLLLPSELQGKAAIYSGVGHRPTCVHCQAGLGSSFSVWPRNKMGCECHLACSPCLPKTWKMGEAKKGESEGTVVDH